MSTFAKYVGMFGTLINSVVGTGNITVTTSSGVATVNGSALAKTDLSNLGTTAVNSNLNMAGSAGNADILCSTGSGGSIGVGLNQTSGTDRRFQDLFLSRAMVVGNPLGVNPPYGANNVLFTGMIEAGNQTNTVFIAGSNTLANSVPLSFMGFLKDGGGANFPSFINLDSAGDNNVYFSLLHRASARTDYLKFGAGDLTFMKSTGANLLWNTDGAGDIGASGATRPNNLFLKTNAVVGGVTLASDGSAGAPSYSFSSVPTTGMFYSVDTSLPTLHLAVAGVSTWIVETDFVGPRQDTTVISPWTINTSGLGVLDTNTYPPYPFKIAYIGDGGLFAGSPDGTNYNTSYAAPIFAVNATIGGAATVISVDSASISCTVRGLAISTQLVAGATAGGSSVCLDGVNVLILQSAGVLATYTVTTPPTPHDGQLFTLTSNNTITALTLSPNTGQTITAAPATLPVGSSIRYVYSSSDTNWYPA